SLSLVGQPTPIRPNVLASRCIWSSDVKLLSFATAALIANACGGSAPPQPPLVARDKGECSVTLSGAVAGPYDFKPALLGAAAFTFWVTNAAFMRFSAAIRVPTPSPATGTYRSDTATMDSLINVLDASGKSWSALAGPDTSPQGSYVLTLSNAQQTFLNNPIWYVDGTLDATLTPVDLTGSSGEISLHAQF